jgi:secretion/DNA translocation related TadE-like protein
MTVSERGTISIVAVTGALILCLGALAAADLGSMLLARARAQSAADSAALAAVVAEAPILGQGDDPETAARTEAARNGSQLIRCDCASGDTVATVEVSVVPRLTFLSGWFGSHVHAEGRAALDPNVLTYRDDG